MAINCKGEEPNQQREMTLSLTPEVKRAAAETNKPARTTIIQESRGGARWFRGPWVEGSGVGKAKTERGRKKEGKWGGEEKDKARGSTLEEKKT